MTASDADRNPVELFAEEFTNRFRQGECPSVSEYVERYPEHAEEIRDLFPSIGMMEQLRRKDRAQREQIQRGARFSSPAPKRIGEYEIIREVGRGGMGVVFEARQPSLGRRVALKVLTAGALSSPKQLMRFRREATAAASLHHTNIVPVFGVGEHEELHYYAMQFIDGVSLEEVLAELRQLDAADPPQPAAPTPDTNDDDVASSFSASSAAKSLFLGKLSGINSPARDARSAARDSGLRLFDFGAVTPRVDRAAIDTPEIAARNTPPAEDASSAPDENPSSPTYSPAQRAAGYWKAVAKLGLQVAEALQFAHSQGVLHRDIKPANLLLDTRGTAWITDFGLAKLAELDGLTKSGDIVGTLRYMAPEQFEGDGDERSDVYSLGLTLYEFVSLRPADATPASELRQINKRDLPAPRKHDPAIPRDLETIVLKATAADAARRYSSAGQLAEDLQRFLEDRPISARRASTVERLWRWGRRNPVTASLTATVFGLLALVAVVASVSNVRTKLALQHADGQRQLAEQARAQAEDQRNLARQEFARADANLNLALDAFKNIIDSLGSRGVPHAFPQELDDDDAPEAIRLDVAVSPADAELLQSLLKFFDEFAARNRADLRVETAQAHRRLGDIRQRLGHFDQAEAAYGEALANYRALAAKEPASGAYAVAQAEILNDLGTVLGKRGRMPQAMAAHQEAQQLLSGQPADIRQTKAARFALAQTLNLLASAGPHVGMHANWRGHHHHHGSGRGPLAGGRARPDDAQPAPDAKGERREFHGDRGERGGEFHRDRPENRGDRPEFRVPPQMTAMRDNYQQALKLLNGLVAEEPNNAEYLLAVARCRRNHAGLSWFNKQPQDSTAPFAQAIGILDRLVADFPQEPRFRFELADTLAMTPPTRPGAEPDPATRRQMERAVKLGQELTTAFAEVPEYRALLAGSRRKLAAIQEAAGEASAAEGNYRQAVALQTALAEQFTLAPSYRISLARMLGAWADFERERGNLSQSRATLEAGIADFEACLKSAEADHLPHYRHALGGLYDSLGRTLRQAGENELSTRAVAKAKEFGHRPWPHAPGRPDGKEGGRPDFTRAKAS